MAEWFFAQDGVQAGPVPQAELAAMVQSGQLPPDTFVWTAGLPDWAPASSFPDLLGAAIGSPPPMASPIPTLPRQAQAFTGYGGFWKRVLATIIDTFIANMAAFIGMIGISFVAMATGTEGQPIFTAIVNFAGFVVPWLYCAGFESSAWQATPGKRLLGMAVTDEHGNRISFLRATGRHFAKILSALILLIGFIMVAFTQRKQGLHDLIAGTLVVNRR